MQKVNIIGGGITGLVCGYELCKKGYAVHLFEKEEQLGGLLATLPMSNETLERIYHHIFTSDTYLLNLIQELGLTYDINWCAPKNGIFIDGALLPFTSPFDLLLFHPIPFFERIATGISVLRARHLHDLDALEAMTAKEWLIKHCGKVSYQKLWKPLLQSKFDKDADEVSAVWIWNKFKLRGNSRDQVSSEKLGYLRGSFGRVNEVLAQKIREMGGVITTGAYATKISVRHEKTQTVTISHKNSTAQFDSDFLIAATAAPIFSTLTGKPVDTIRYKANLCMILRLSKPLSAYYWTSICADVPFVLVIEQNNLTGNRGYGGHIVYLSRYLDKTDPLWTAGDEEIYGQFTEGLCRLYPGFKKTQVQEYHLLRSPYAQPVVGRHYSKQIPPIKSEIPGIFIAGMSQIYPEDRGMNYAVRLGMETVRTLVDMSDRRMI